MDKNKISLSLVSLLGKLIGQEGDPPNNRQSIHEYLKLVKSGALY